VKRSVGESPHIPREIHGRVHAVAQRLGRQVAGDDLFLIALTELPDDAPARAALEVEGITSERLRSEVRTGGDEPFEAPRGITFAPAFYVMQGRAEAFAATLGDGAVTPEHVLLAILWDPNDASSQLLWRLGVSRERIVEQLRHLGVAVPKPPPPPQREIEDGERVWFNRSDVERVLRYLHRKIPPGTVWGFNYEAERAWAIAESSVDLQTLVDQATNNAD
jgi:ATP-dependent Clp protease ATP-binding subunit ClpA